MSTSAPAPGPPDGADPGQRDAEQQTTQQTGTAMADTRTSAGG